MKCTARSLTTMLRPNTQHQASTSDLRLSEAIQGNGTTTTGEAQAQSALQTKVSAPLCAVALCRHSSRAKRRLRSMIKYKMPGLHGSRDHLIHGPQHLLPTCFRAWLSWLERFRVTDAHSQDSNSATRTSPHELVCPKFIHRPGVTTESGNQSNPS